jgi:carboxymethylenebutenolidase
MNRRKVLYAAVLLGVAVACSRAAQEVSSAGGAAGPIGTPPSQGTSAEQLSTSPRRGEWVTIAAGQGDSVRAWVVYPERATRAPVVLAVHDINGMGPWIRAVADQLAEDGFIAIAPDLLSGKGVPVDAEGHHTGSTIGETIRQLSADEIDRRMKAVARWGTSRPNAADRYGIMGFCWGGSTVFLEATRDPELDAVVVYYGTSPATETLRSIQAPILGLYGGNDARVNTTIAPADAELERLGKVYEQRIYEGAGHGFLRSQNAAAPAEPNTRASLQAWPETVNWFRRYLGS